MDASGGNTEIGGLGARGDGGPGLLVIGCLAACVTVAFAPTFAKLIAGPWRGVHPGTGPAPIPRLGHPFRPHRVAIDVKQGRAQMRIIQRARKEAILPEMPDRVSPPVPF